jgi:hypothetical protein
LSSRSSRRRDGNAAVAQRISGSASTDAGCADAPEIIQKRINSPKYALEKLG